MYKGVTGEENGLEQVTETETPACGRRELEALLVSQVRVSHVRSG